MAPLTLAELTDSPGNYDSDRGLGDVLVGDDSAQPLIEASASGDNTALQKLLSQPQWSKIMLEESYTIYYQSRPSQGPNDVRSVGAMQISNLERALTAAAKNGQAAIVPTLIAFAAGQGMQPSDLITYQVVKSTIHNGHANVLEALATAQPDVINLHLPHGVLPLYEAARVRQTDVVAMLLRLGADPLQPVYGLKEIGGFNSSLLSKAAMAESPRMLELLLQRGLPLAGSAALHTTARSGRLDNMRCLLQHGADVNEVLSGWTPLHFAASKGRIEAMKLLEQSGARSDTLDEDGKTPAQVLEESVADQTE